MEVWAERTPPPRATLMETIRDVEGLYCLLSERIDAEVLDAAPRLQTVSVMAVGTDNVDLDACTERGIPVGHTPGVLTETTADLTWALMLAVARRLPEAQRAVHHGDWLTWEPLGYLGRDVHGASLGIVGLGRIGEAVARRARGFGMTIRYHNRNRRPEAERDLGAEYADLDALLERSDFVSLHVPLNDATHRLIDEAALARMTPTAILINTARGEVVDTDALHRALSNGEIAAATLDVTDPEPLPADHPLLTLDNCLVTPHIGSASRATRERMARMAADNLLAGLRGDRPPHCANPDVFSSSP